MAGSGRIGRLIKGRFRDWRWAPAGLRRPTTNHEGVPCAPMKEIQCDNEEVRWSVMVSPHPAAHRTVAFILVVLASVSAFAQSTSSPAQSFALLHCDEVSTGKIRLRIILVDSRSRAEAVLDALKKGQSFADLAKQYSTDAGTRDDGGLVGLISEGDLREEFRAALKGVRAGETTGIIPLGSRTAQQSSPPPRSAGQIHTAAKKGDVATLKALLAQGADVNAKDEQGVTPLLYAALQGRKAAVELLLNNGAKADSATSEGATALHLTARYGEIEIASMLVAKGASVNARTFADGLRRSKRVRADGRVPALKGCESKRGDQGRERPAKRVGDRGLESRPR